MQLHLLSSLIFGVSSSMDSFVIGLSYGVRKLTISWKLNVLISFITFSGTLLAMTLGKSVLLFLPDALARACGSLILFSIGAAGFLRWLLRKKTVPETEAAAAVPLNRQEAILLGAALSLNNVSMGVGATIAGLPVLCTAACSFFCSLLFLFAGNRAGHSRLFGGIGKFSEPLANLLMIGLSFLQFFP